MPRIYFFKNPVDNDPYEALFREMGWVTHSIPILAFEFVNKKELEEQLKNADAYSGLIWTSMRGVQAVQEHALDPELLAWWRGKPIYVVGPATKRAVELLGLSPVGEDTGNAEALAHFIVQHHTDKEKPLLFICGSSRRDELPSILHTTPIGLKECVVYHTHATAPTNLEQLEAPDVVVFFSPSGVHALEGSWPSRWGGADIVSIGPRTTEALNDAGREVLSTSIHPTPESLLEAVLHPCKPLSISPSRGDVP
ncbi:MAG: uroporphyrinogen-III synthase [Rhodothermaceae bacterium]|nr:uroporphyrinogen-III synthase [Rhodothermaceae bacterium]